METTIHCEKQPQPIELDGEGNEFIRGNRVAFNYMGKVKIGILLEIVKNHFEASRNGIGKKYWWSLRFEAKVRHIGSNKISTIKNPNSIINI